MATERILEADWKKSKDHIYRYRLASNWIKNKESVLDFGCGIGYGSKVIAETKKINYLGMDKINPSSSFYSYGNFVGGINLDEWEPKDEWDVSVSFEILEHVKNPQRLADNLKKAKRLVILSTPTRPTKHNNIYHLHDFTVDEVLSMFEDCKLLHIEDQPTQLSHIFVWQTNFEGEST
jgi:2-polyprenyl-3-methyl-5-hydroxy-6-metoxy-1,4-benzoquinol methylase